MAENGPNELYLIRHGATDANENGILQGSKEFSLSPLGLYQSRMLSQRLKENNLNIKAVISSTQNRACQTAEILSMELGLHTIQIPGLEECSLGVIEGFTPEQVKTKFPAVWQTARETSWGDAAPGGENRRQLLARVKPVLEQLCLITNDLGGPVVIVTHTSVLKAIIAEITGLLSEQKWPYIFNNASISVVQISKERREIKLLNDCCHLTKKGINIEEY